LKILACNVCKLGSASTLGLGFLLLQKPTNSNSDWRVVQAGSRFLTDAESNGKAEATVKSMKIILAAWTGHSVNWDQISRAFVQYRNTPCWKDGLSPTRKLLGNPVQDTLPVHRRSFAPEWQRSSLEADSAATHTSETSQATYDQHAHHLSDLQVGNHIAVQNPTSKMWVIYGTITAIGPHRRYFIKTQWPHP